MGNSNENQNIDKNNLSGQPNIPTIPDISCIPPLPELKDDNPSPVNVEPNKQNEYFANEIPNQQTVAEQQNSQRKGFDSSNMEFAKQQQQYANKNLGYAGNNDQSNQSQVNYNKQQGYGYGVQNTILMNIPNSGGILTLGIISIVSICCCGGLLAPILSIIALAMIPKAKKAYSQNPQIYKLSSLNNLKAGQICAIIGLIITAILWIFVIILIIVDGISINEVNEVINEAWNETGY